MARRRRTRGGGGSDNSPNWMDTYGDMITLVLCFFVILVSSMKTDQEKWETLVRSLNPKVDVVSQIVDVNAVDPGQNPVAGGTDKVQDPAEALYDILQHYVEQSGIGTNINVGHGDGYDFITFDSTVFFSADSYSLLDSGKQVLDGLATIIQSMVDDIDEIRILGHTSQASAEGAHDLHKDRYLASNRADAVLLYLQDKRIIDPAKLVSVGYGQYRPIASFDTAEGRSKNRRVEMVIYTKQPGKESAMDVYYHSRAGGRAAEDVQ